jgi:hypothetical protein
MHRVKPATEQTFDGAHDPAAVLRKRLGLARPSRPPRPRWPHQTRLEMRTRTGDLIETVKQVVLGHGHVVERCSECGHDDLPERIRAEHEPT